MAVSTPPPRQDTFALAQAQALQLAIVGALVTLALALYARSLDLLRTDVPLRAGNGRTFWIATLAAAVATAFVVQWVWAKASLWERQVGRPSRLPANTHLPTAGVLPGGSILASLQLVAWDGRTAVMLAAPLLAAAGVFTAVVVRYNLFGGDSSVFSGARLVHTLLTGAIGFLSLSLVHQYMASGWYTAVAAFVLAAILLVQAFDGLRVAPVRRVAYALAGGIVVAEAAWALTYWPVSGWYGGAILTAAFVVLMLVIEAHFSRRASAELVGWYAGAGVFISGLFAVLAR